MIQIFERESFNTSRCFSIVDCSLFESVPFGGAAKGSGFNGHFASSMRRQQKTNRSSTFLEDRQTGAKGSKTREDVTKIFESDAEPLSGLEREKDFKGLFLDFDTKSKAISNGKEEPTWTGTANVVDDSPLFLLQDRSRRVENKTHKLQMATVHGGVFSLSDAQPTSHKWKGASKIERNLRTTEHKRKKKYDSLFLNVAPVRGLARRVAAGSSSGLFADPGETFAGAGTEREDKRRVRTGSSRAIS